jgi:hypothetical protein
VNTFRLFLAVETEVVMWKLKSSPQTASREKSASTLADMEH